MILEATGILAAIAMVFYDSLLAALVLSPLLFPICLRRERLDVNRRREELVREFKECMTSILTSMKAGNSAENAFRDAGGEMAFFFGSRSEICRELDLIVRGLDSNVPLEELLENFAGHSGSAEIQDFADVFAIAKRSGGNMTEILNRTISQIQNRIEVEQEIGVIISSSRLEQRIMDIVPFGIIIYIRLTSGNFMDVLYHNAVGILIMSVCLAVYLAAYLLSERISAIHV